MGNSQAKPCFSDEVNLSHFRLLRVVGRGAFGKVRIVERKDTGLTFALKYIRKADGEFYQLIKALNSLTFVLVIRSESVRNILRERRMLEQLNYKFICNLRYSFQDIEYMYLVVDLMDGGDLRFHISRKTFTEDAVRFWISELGLALRYIHSQGIVHRDIKPDNVLLDAEGHVHLADFNVASDITPGKKLTSKSGTLAYLAPEVLKGNGYSFGADWWSLGVLFYECIYNKRPFEKQSSAGLQAQILQVNPNFPLTDPPVSIVCMHAISSALEEDPNKRMGCLKDEEFLSFTDNPFFRPIDFEALERKEIEPVFIPSNQKTNFDASYDLEELLLEEAPLEARMRRQKPREQLKEDATEKEIKEEEMYKLIDEEFTPFDYTTAVYEKYNFYSISINFGLIVICRYVGVNLNNDLINQNSPLSYKYHYNNSANNAAQISPSTKHEFSKLHSHIPSNISPVINSPTSNHHLQSFGLNSQSPIRDRTNKSTPPPLSPSRPIYRKIKSSSSGLNLNLKENESVPELGLNDTNSPAESGTKSINMFSFFTRKKSQSHYPKPKERGVLGKEGARVIIKNSE
ncbi:Serine/threonine-protein kinase 32A [Erysiphe neolycopersici]|uniref:Serine/threonine-protein kinase 32A n=1 Tax=Erysiphe neolycopersici TaxID=212602 RepID=A0A420HVD9_9PEZI|nr:Serine/threonine-protein kinase 32A [Erysiphe neolycopersici]